MNNQARLFSSGMKPVYRCTSTGEWKRIPGKCSYQCTNKEFSIEFVHVFNSLPDEKVFFAFTFPFSYTDCEDKLNRLQAKYGSHPSIYFHRETAILSCESRKMELLTITSHTNKTEEREPLIDGLFPLSKGDKSTRPFIFDKPTVFFTARVHPGEVPGSLILNGVLDFLLDETNEQSKLLRDCYTFKIVPILNPDGVSRGHYRLDTLGQNLNRFYTDPTIDKQPTIFATKKLLIQQSELKKIKLYIDFHAHACKKGCFIFGNSLSGLEQVENMAFPKLVSLNSLNFDFAECSFNERMMSIKDKRDGLSREGAARVAIYKQIGLINCYTLECNYNTGKRINYIPPKYNKAKKSNDPEKPVTDISSKIYNSKRVYT